MSDFEIVTTTAGAISIRNKVVNEIMHNPVGPWKEANDLYVTQSRLRERFQRDVPSALVLFDVGLGAASNALAALHAYQDAASQGPCRPFHIVSYENNLELLRFALENASVFPHMAGYEDTLATLLASNTWTSSDGRIQWDLKVGDFLDTVSEPTPVPEVIFYDPYSPVVNGEMWSLECLQTLYKKCLPVTDGTLLLTYSIATPIRTAFLLAGFFVGHGIPTGLKSETTQASTRLEMLSEPLAEKWFGRWVRSQSKFPLYTQPHQEAERRETLNRHPQVEPLLHLAEKLLKAAFPGRPRRQAR